MRSLVKLAVAGALLASTSAAFADATAPGTGNGELVLFVRDLANESRVYARGLGITMDDLLTQAAITGDPTKPANNTPGFADTDTLTYTLPSSITADANLSTFLAGRTNFVWSIIGGDTTGGANAEGARRYVTTSQVDFGTQQSTITNADIVAGGSYDNLNGMWVALNGTLDNTAGASTHADAANPSGWQDGWWGEAGTSYTAATNWFGVAGPNNNNALGSAAHLYVVAGSGGGGSMYARIYKGIDITLSSTGTLSSASVTPPQVPLPAAVWLLGSALVGFAGISRRRKAEAA
jgi:hypothetical protein